MTDRTCIRGCTQKGIHFATCPDYGKAETFAEARAAGVQGISYTPTCTGCAPREARDGYWCEKCFGRARHLLDDAPDVEGRIRSAIDPSKATVLDQVRARVMATEPPAAVASDPLDALNAVGAVLDFWYTWGEDLKRISNDLDAVTWLGEHLFQRHKPEDGIREAWSVQDAADSWPAERRTDERYVFPEEDGEVVVGAVHEFFDPTLTVKQAAKRCEVTQQAVRKWVAAGVLTPRMKVKGPRGSVMSLFYASEVDAAAELMAERGNATKFKKTPGDPAGVAQSLLG